MSRSAFCTIAGIDFELIYNVASMKLISEKFGSVRKFIERIIKAGEDEDEIGLYDGLIEAFAICANQSIMRDGMHDSSMRRLWTAKELALIFSPSDMIQVERAITDAMNKGNSRAVESEDDTDPNAEAE